MTGIRLKIVLGFALALIILAAYWPVLQGEFITCDDPGMVLNNPVVSSGLTLKGISWALTTSSFEYWHPLTWLSHMLDCELFGLRPGWHHLVSVGFHVANTILLFAVLRCMTGTFCRSGIVAALFALHPLHVESVTWIAERKDLLSTFFGLLAIMAYAVYAQKSEVAGRTATHHTPHTAHCFSRFTSHSSRFYFLSLLFFALSLMSKPMLVTLPFLLLLLDWWPLQRLQPVDRRSLSRNLFPLVREKLPFLALTVASCAITWMGVKAGGNLASAETVPWGLRLAYVPVSYIRYLGKMFWPADLAVLYPMPSHWAWWEVAGATFLLASISIGVLLLRGWPWLLTGWSWFVGMLVPVIGLVQVGEQFSADRYSYLPLVGLFVALIWTAGQFQAGWPRGRMLLAGFAGVILLGCSLLTHQQVRLWQNSITLFEHSLAVTGNNAEAENNLATALALQRRFEEALPHYEAALRLRPRSANVHCNFGIALAQQGQRLEDARRHLLLALELQPANLSAYYHLACVAASQGEWGEATTHYQQALRLRPDFPEARNELGVALLQEGKPEEAVAQFHIVLNEQPAFAAARYNLGEALLKLQRAKDAIDQFQAALRLRPDWPEVLNNLAWLLATHPKADVRNGLEAVSLAQRACHLTSRTNFWLLSTLAAAYAEAGRFPEAVSIQQNVCELTTAQGHAADAFQQRLALYRAGHAYHRP